MDLDNVTFDEARGRWEDLLPPPSIAVASGHGFHAYWLLRRPYDLRNKQHRERFETMLKSLCADLGADATSDVSRILRIPGTWNVKDIRNGRNPEPCVLIHCQPERQYPLETFKAWFDRAKARDRATSSSQRQLPRTDISASGGNVATAVQRLDERASDRSRRDFAVICDLIRLGLEPESIWHLVRDRSKFATHGREYFDVTLKNAVRNLGV